MRKTIVKPLIKSIALSFDDNTLLPYLYGEQNAHLHHIEQLLSIDIGCRSNKLELKGHPKDVLIADELFKMLWEKLNREQDVTTSEIDAALRFLKEKEKDMTDLKEVKSAPPKKGKKKSAFYDEKSGIKTYKNKLISPRSPNQAFYINAIRDHDMVFGVGPAGTGKTFLAVAAAVSMFQEGLIERMVFCRPAVEAGENLGFLPGSMIEKIDPYLRPIYDALNEMMPADQLPKKLESGEIEIAPLAFMRGRTLKNAFVVLDEAQNTTSMQMKMFLTRMGEGTRMVITGDPTQVDLPSNAQSGLKEAMNILGNIDDIPFVHFDSKDVVRHKLVTKIINAYDKYEFRSTRA